MNSKVVKFSLEIKSYFSILTFCLFQNKYSVFWLIASCRLQIFQSFKQETTGSSRSVLAYDAQDLASFHFKINVLQSPNVVTFAFGASVVGVTYFEIGVFLAPHLVPPTVQVVTERACSYLSEAVLFGDVFGFEDDVFQGTRLEVRSLKLFKGLMLADWYCHWNWYCHCFFSSKALRHKVILFFLI